MEIHDAHGRAAFLPDLLGITNPPADLVAKNMGFGRVPMASWVALEVLVVVIEGDYRLSGLGGRRYDIDPSGERFLLITYAALGADSRSLPSLTFVLNWFQELTERVPLP